VDQRDPRWELYVDGSRLPDAYRDLVQGISLNSSWDKAAMLRLTMRSWDDLGARYRVVGENLFGPGASVVFKAGYGREVTTIGRFDLARFEPSFGEKGPTVDLVCYDGLARYMDDTYPKDFGTPKTYTAVAQTLADYHGMELDADLSREIEHRKRQVTKRRTTQGVNLGALFSGNLKKVKYTKVTTSQQTITSKLVKKAGDSDLKFLKWLSQSCGFLQAQVRYNPETGRDVLVFKKPRLEQPEVGGAFVFRYVYRGGDTTLASFAPAMTIKGKPQAVRITGRSPDRKRLIVVEAELEGDDLRRGADAIRVTTRDGGPIQRQDKSTFDRPGRVILQITGDQAAGQEMNWVKQRQEQTLLREVIKPQIVDGVQGSLEELAASWLRSRIGLWVTAEAKIRGILDTHTIAANQIHGFHGTTPEYDGWYMVREANHTWNRVGIHEVDLKLQKLGEIKSGAQKITLKTSRADG
jgi:hypothetical protein